MGQWKMPASPKRKKQNFAFPNWVVEVYDAKSHTWNEVITFRNKDRASDMAARIQRKDGLTRSRIRRLDLNG